jgi:hypothetical protein
MLELDRASALTLVGQLQQGRASRFRKKRQFVYGALYDKLWWGHKTIDLSGGLCTHVDIVVTVENGETTVVRIGSAKDESVLLKAIVGLGKELPSGGNARNKVGDEGDMFALGYKSTKNADIYAPTKNELIGVAMARAATAAGKYMKRHWLSDYNNIREADSLKTETATQLPVEPLKEMGGKDGPGHVIMISRNLGNSSHVDYADASRSIAFWVEEKPGQAKNWYFLLPNVSIEESKGVVIKLFHGAVISWDGSKIRHCSSITKPGNDNNVYGCMFGSCR